MWRDWDRQKSVIAQLSAIVGITDPVPAQRSLRSGYAVICFVHSSSRPDTLAKSASGDYL